MSSPNIDLTITALKHDVFAVKSYIELHEDMGKRMKLLVKKGNKSAEPVVIAHEAKALAYRKAYEMILETLRDAEHRYLVENCPEDEDQEIFA